MSSPRSNRHKVSLTSGAGSFPTASLHIDDMDVSRSVTSVEITADAREGLSATVHFYQPPIDVDLAEARVLVDDDMSALLIRLGWTPPPEEALDVVD